jgi:hypothetical protein
MALNELSSHCSCGSNGHFPGPQGPSANSSSGWPVVTDETFNHPAFFRPPLGGNRLCSSLISSTCVHLTSKWVLLPSSESRLWHDFPAGEEEQVSWLCLVSWLEAAGPSSGPSTGHRGRILWWSQHGGSMVPTPWSNLGCLEFMFRKKSYLQLHTNTKEVYDKGLISSKLDQIDM